MSVSVVIAILLSALAVFILSAVLHMMLGYHADDFKSVPNEDAVQDALGRIAPGDYAVPRPATPAAMKSPEFAARMKAGPIVFMTLQPGQSMTMVRELSLWFVFNVVVGVFVAYVTGHATAVDASFMNVFRIASVTAFMGYGLAHWADTIWYKRSAMTNLKNTFDAMLYGLATGAIFAWLLS